MLAIGEVFGIEGSHRSLILSKAKRLIIDKTIASKVEIDKIVLVFSILWLTSANTIQKQLVGISIYYKELLCIVRTILIQILLQSRAYKA